MKQTKNFNISVPELGDKPDITQVSDAIQALEDALAGTLEVMNAEIQGTKLTLTSGARATKRTKYYEGMAIKFVAPIQINPNTVTTVSVDGLSDQTLEIPYLVNAGDSVDIIYKEDKFVGAITAIQRSNAIDSTSDVTVGTSLAVKTAYDKGAEALNKANEAKSTAETMLPKGGFDGTAQTLNNKKVDKSGDSMTGKLTISGIGDGLEIIDGATNNPRTTFYNSHARVALGLSGEDDSSSYPLKVMGYDGSNPRRIYHEGFKPTHFDTDSMWKKNLGSVSFGLGEDINYAHLAIPNAKGTSGNFDVSIKGSWSNLQIGGTMTVSCTYMIGANGSVPISTTRLKATSSAFYQALDKFMISDPWFSEENNIVFVTIYYKNPNQPAPVDIFVSNANGSTSTIEKIYLYTSGHTNAEQLALQPYSGSIFYTDTRNPNRLAMRTVCRTNLECDGVVVSNSGSNFNGKGTDGFGTNFHIQGTGGMSNSVGCGVGLHENGNTYFWNNKDTSPDLYTMVVGRGGVEINAPTRVNSTITATGRIKTYEKVFAHARDDHGAEPDISLAIGDQDTGFNWESDGTIQIWTNSQSRGYWNAVTFYYGGAIVAGDNVVAYSDIRLKKDLEIIPNAIDKIQELNGYTYTRRDTGERHSGVVAQEVEKVLPEVITKTKDSDGVETLGVAYGNMVGLLIEGIKEQQKQIEELKKRIEELEGR